MLQWVLTPSCPEAVLTSRIHGKRVASIVPHENGRVGKEVNLGPLRRCAQLRQTSVEQKSEQALSILCERRGGRGSRLQEGARRGAQLTSAPAATRGRSPAEA